MTDQLDKSRFENAYADKAPWDIPGPQPVFVQVAEKVKSPVLDAGCGTGENALFFAGRGLEVTGIDYLDEPIRRAKQKAAERGLEVNFQVADATKLQELGGKFATAIDSGLFHVFGDEDRQRYVSGLASVLAPGGKLMMMCFSDKEPAGNGPRRIAVTELEDAFSDGWAIESITATRFQTIPEFEAAFTPGGPQAWFVVVKRG